MSRFGDHIRHRREILQSTYGGYSLRQTAERIGVSAVFLSQVENGKGVPSEENISKLAEVLKDDKDLLMAIAGKLPKDIEEAMQKKPGLLGIMRALKDKTESELQKIAEKIEIREGDW